MKEIKRQTKSFLAIIMAVLILALAGCAPSNPPADTSASKSPEPAVSTSTPASKPDETKESTSATDPPPVADTIVIEDMGGREITVPTPENFKKVYFPSPLAQVMIYTINPDLLAGVVSEPNPNQLKYLPRLAGLKVFGNSDGGQAVNTEEVLASGAQAYIFMGPMEITDNVREKCDELQTQLGIPVILVNGRFPERASAYRFLGKVFGEEERCEKLAAYCEQTLNDVNEKVGAIPEEDRVTLYYAEKPNGLATEPDTSSHFAVFKYAGAINVADVEDVQGSGMTPVNLEQVIQWNPSVIFMGGGPNSPYEEITTNPNWANIEAVKEGRVYEAPGIPYSWIDRPPSSQQYLGVRFVTNILYPDVFQYDMAQEVKDFFELFYDVELSDEDVDFLLKSARGHDHNE